MNYFKNIIFFLLTLQERILTARLAGTINAKSTARKKRYYTNGCSISLDTVADEEKNKMEEELLLILKQANFQPEQILEYIQKQGTNVYYINNVKYINAIGENEGFIYPQKGAKAVYLSLLTSRKFSVKTPEMFVLTKNKINTYMFIYHFYNWYAFKHDIFGIDPNSQDMLNKYLYNATDEEINSLQLTDIYKLKDAIKQDKASIEFVFKLCRQYESSKKALEKLKNDGANI